LGLQPKKLVGFAVQLKNCHASTALFFVKTWRGLWHTHWAEIYLSTNWKTLTKLRLENVSQLSERYWSSFGQTLQIFSEIKNIASRGTNVSSLMKFSQILSQSRSLDVLSSDTECLFELANVPIEEQVNLKEQIVSQCSQLFQLIYHFLLKAIAI